MEIEYELDQSDYIALARYQVSRSTIARQRYLARRFGYLIGFGLMSLGSYLVLNSMLLSILFGMLAVIIFVLYPIYFRWALEKNIHRIVHERATPGSYSRRVLRVTPDGLEQINEDSKSKVSWNLVDDIFVASTHAFLSLDGTYSVVIPRARLEEAQFTTFLGALRQYRESALTAISPSGTEPAS